MTSLKIYDIIKEKVKERLELMFDIMVTKKDIAAVKDYIQNKGLVAHMNDAGLSIGAMALVLNAIENECTRILIEMTGEEED